MIDLLLDVLVNIKTEYEHEIDKESEGKESEVIRD